jgi:Uma2 family endonuclease
LGFSPNLINNIEVIPMTSLLKQKYYTPEEYLAQEETSDSRNEYIDGEIIPMTGGTPNHNEIALNVASYLKFALRGKKYKVYITDLRLWIPNYRVYTYPDIMVIEGQPILVENRKDTVTNPTLIIEILSKTTKNYDQGDKFDYYCSIPIFQEYILVDQYRYHVKHYSKTGDEKWLLNTYHSENDILTITSFDFKIKLSEIYEEITFEAI